jgi:D-tyrosyl-tRNA(Tyr) deacylase
MTESLCTEGNHHALESAGLPFLFEEIRQSQRLAIPSYQVHWRMAISCRWSPPKASALCTVTSVTRKIENLNIDVQHVQKLSVVGKSLLIMFFIRGITMMTKKVLLRSH